MTTILHRKESLACSRCHGPFSTGVFSTPDGLRFYCAQCAFDVKSKSYPITCVTLISYGSAPEEPEYEPTPVPKPIPRTIGNLTLVALVRLATHQPMLMAECDAWHKGNPYARWYKRVTCSSCKITYCAAAPKACPSCGEVNKP